MTRNVVVLMIMLSIIVTLFIPILVIILMIMMPNLVNLMMPKKTPVTYYDAKSKNFDDVKYFLSVKSNVLSNTKNKQIYFLQLFSILF